MVVGIEGVHAAKRQLYSSSGGRKSAPRSQMRAANHDFQHDRLLRDVTPQNFYLQVGKSRHELRVEAPDFIPADVVRVPRTILILGTAAEGADHAIKIVLIFKPHVLLDESNARG